VLDRLSHEVHESCSLAILDDQEIVYLARSTSSKIMSVILNIGRRLPAYCTSIGQVLLANLDEAARENYLSTVKLLPFTDRTITAPEKLRRVLAHVREVDYAVVDRQMEGRLMTIGVPVRDKFGAVVAGMNVIVTAGRIPAGDMTSRFLSPLQSAAGELGSLVAQ
jgi:IclR family pca regulon transcriptional regulator